MPTEILFLIYSLSFIVTVKLVLLIYFNLRLSKKLGQKNTYIHPISVIVAARNEGDNLEKLIPALLNQSYPDYEVIIVLDRCSDHSLELVKKWEAENAKLKCVIVDALPDHFSPKKYALTLGIKKAKNEWLLMTDADCMPASSQWIQEMNQTISQNCHAVIGMAPLQVAKGWLGIFQEFETFQTALYMTGFAQSGNAYMALGRNWAFRKSDFLTNKGYHQYQHNHGGDDDLLIQQIGHQQQVNVCLSSHAHVYSEAKQDWKSYLEQKKRHFAVSRFYRKKYQLLLSTIQILTLLIWSLMFIGVVFTEWGLIFFVIWLLFYLFSATLHWIISSKLGIRYRYGFLPILELFYIIFVPVVMVWSRFSHQIKWK